MIYSHGLLYYFHNKIWFYSCINRQTYICCYFTSYWHCNWEWSYCCRSTGHHSETPLEWDCETTNTLLSHLWKKRLSVHNVSRIHLFSMQLWFCGSACFRHFTCNTSELRFVSAFLMNSISVSLVHLILFYSFVLSWIPKKLRSLQQVHEKRLLFKNVFPKVSLYEALNQAVQFTELYSTPPGGSVLCVTSNWGDETQTITKQMNLWRTIYG